MSRSRCIRRAAPPALNSPHRPVDEPSAMTTVRRPVDEPSSVTTVRRRSHPRSPHHLRGRRPIRPGTGPAEVASRGLEHDATSSPALRPRHVMTSSTLWQCLLDGRWSIIGRYDRNARQVLVARENDPTLMKARALTDRERQIVDHAATGKSNKQIAYEVGLSIGSVSGYLSSALRKMGVSSRAELVVVAPPREVTRGASRAPLAIGCRISGRST